MSAEAASQTALPPLIEKYIELGWTLTRIPVGQKRATDTGWTTAPPPTDAELHRWFGRGSWNVGLRTGSISGDLHDIDGDDDRIIPFLNALAPDWAASCPRWTRGGRPHVLVRCQEPIPYRQLTYVGRCLIEIRGDKHQSVLPPSIHPSGDTYVWISGPHQPALVSGTEVVAWVQDAVTAFGLAQCWTEGSRHQAALAFGGWMARKRVPMDRTVAIVEVAARQSGDDQISEHRAAVADSYAAVAADRSATGWPTLERLLPVDVVALLRDVFPRTTADDEERSGSYVAKAGSVFARKRGGGDEAELFRLANFDARIIRQLERDDGSGAIEREFEIGGRKASGLSLPDIRVPAGSFGGMNWVLHNFGADAVVSAGATNKDKLREAIQLLSGRPPTQRVFSHTGWRRIGDNWVFLHAGSDEATVDLEGNLRHYRLPPQPADPSAAVRASLSLRSLGDRPVLTALWCATFLAPIAEMLRPDPVVWLWGPTGSFKSSVSALFLSHFGQFKRKSLPADWSSTENALERVGFIAKDVLLVIDECAPAPSRRDQDALKTKVAAFCGHRAMPPAARG